MSLHDEVLRVNQMISGLTVNWSIFQIDFGTLDMIESGATNGDNVLVCAQRDLLSALKAITRVEDYNAMSQAYEIYEEAAIYLLLRCRGLPLIRTPKTGSYGQKKPDFECNHRYGRFYVEVKTLDFQDGWLRHSEIAYAALDANAKLDSRARKQGVHVGNPVDISSYRPGSGAADRIEVAIKKIKGNAKIDQLSYGPTILVVDMTRLFCDADDPSALLPTYYDGSPTVQSCVSGELWHIAFGEVHDLILVKPEFEGKSNIDRRLRENGVYVEYPELMALVFVTRRLNNTAKIFAMCKSSPDFSKLQNKTNLKYGHIAEIVSKFCDAANDDRNEGAFGIQVKM